MSSTIQVRPLKTGISSFFCYRKSAWRADRRAPLTMEHQGQNRSKYMWRCVRHSTGSILPPQWIKPILLIAFPLQSFLLCSFPPFFWLISLLYLCGGGGVEVSSLAVYPLVYPLGYNGQFHSNSHTSPQD